MVPDIPTFAVDDGFSYRVPESLSNVEVGAVVRIPLSGRRVRGYVTAIRSGEDSARLRDIAGVVGELPIFDQRLLETLRWAAIHYVAPVATILGKAGPPNAARRLKVTPMMQPDTDATPPPRQRAKYLLGAGPWTAVVAERAMPWLQAGRNVVVIAPSVHEASALRDDLAAVTKLKPFLVTSSEKAAIRTRAWVSAVIAPGQLIVGTRELAPWHLGALGEVMVIEEGRPAMKAPQTPTIGVQALLRRRSVIERFQLTYLGAVPTLDAIASGAEVIPPGRRIWPLIELADRGEEPPSGRVMLDAVQQAIQGAVRRQGSVFVFVPRRGDAVAFRCVNCGTVRRCASCGAAISRAGACQRCGVVPGACGECGADRFHGLGAATGSVLESIRRWAGDKVGEVGSDCQIAVGTERDIPMIHDVDLAVVIDADGMLFAPHHKAEEDALRTLARVSLTVQRAKGRRCLIQTSQPNHRVFAALRSGDPRDLLAELIVDATTAGFPPISELMILELVNGASSVGDDLAAVADGVQLIGPGEQRDRQRWLVLAPDLRDFKIRLRGLVQQWRDGGATVRIDPDPVRP